MKKNKLRGRALWNKAKQVIPGGTQLLSKRSEMFLPDGWPSYYKKAKGVDVWDLDGNRYVDMSLMGVGSCILGYADLDVNRAVKRVIDAGSMNTLNSPEEVELADVLLELHPWAGMARFARTGGEAMAVAGRIARARSRRDKVAICGYHGWSDWYLAANLAKKKSLDGHLLPGLDPAGVPRGLRGTAFTFSYNNIDELKKLVSAHPDIGVIVVEPMRHQEPKDGFLSDIATIARKIKAVLIFDEISIGWRMTVGGVHLLYGVNPDITVFAKAMSNGYPMAAIIGKKKVMQAAQSTFISSTYWTERVGPAAALATIQKMKNRDVPAHLQKIGSAIAEGWLKLIDKHQLKASVLGPMSLVTLEWDYGPLTQAVRTLFTQEMLRRGFLASASVYVSYAHTEAHVKRYLRAADEVFGLLKKAIVNKNVDTLLKGPVAHSGFRRLT